MDVGLDDQSCDNWWPIERRHVHGQLNADMCTCARNVMMPTCFPRSEKRRSVERDGECLSPFSKWFLEDCVGRFIKAYEVCVRMVCWICDLQLGSVWAKLRLCYRSVVKAKECREKLRSFQFQKAWRSSADSKKQANWVDKLCVDGGLRTNWPDVVAKQKNWVIALGGRLYHP